MTISSRLSSRLYVTFVLAASVALGASAVACSSSSDNGEPSGTGSGVDGGGTGPGADGGGTSNLDGGAGSDSSGPSGPVKSGFVLVSQSTFSSTTTHTAMAAFSTLPAGSTTSSTSCTTSTQGDCKVTTCQTSDAGSGAVDAGEAGTGPTADSAGVVTISGGKLASAITLTPDAKNSYTPASAAGAAFAAGDKVKVSAAGATVPAFESEVAAPGDITVTAPTFSSFATSFSKSSDLAITWTGGGAGDVNVSIGSANGAKTVGIQCKFAANGGSGTVPAAALADIGSSGSISIAPSVVTSLKAGDYDVVYTLSATGASGTFSAN